MSTIIRPSFLVLLACCGLTARLAAATAEDFGFDRMGKHPHPNRPLLLLIASFASTPARMSAGVSFPAVARNPLARTAAQIDDFVFDPVNFPPNPGIYAGRTINAAFLEMSAGNFLWTRAASFPLRSFSQAETQVLEELSEPFRDTKLRIYALETTRGLNFVVSKFLDDNPGFDLSAFDSNGDFVVTEDELTVMLISNYGERSGANRSLNLSNLANRADPAHPLTLRGPLAWLDHRTSFSTYVHELSHSLGTFDLYNGNQVAGGATNANSYGFLSTLMGPTLSSNNDDPSTWHPDPWHKMRLGWLRPRLVPMSRGGGYVLRCSQRPGNEGAILLYNDALPASEIAREFFMIEYRSPAPPTGAGYDASVAAEGLLVWHIGTDSNGAPYRLPDPTNPPKDPNGPVSVIVEGRNAANNGYALGGDNSNPPTQVWTPNFFLSLPPLRGFNGSPANSRIQASPGADRNWVFFELLLSADAWVEFREQVPGMVELGTFDLPWNTFAEGYSAAPWGGRVRVKPGQTLETGVFSKRITITAEGGTVTIGNR